MLSSRPLASKSSFRLRVGFNNVNKLSNKIHFISSLLFEHGLHVFGVAETWLLPSVPDSFVSIKGFNIFRSDVAGTEAKHGVCLFVRADMTVEYVEVEYPNVVCIKLVKFGIFLWSSIVHPHIAGMRTGS